MDTQSFLRDVARRFACDDDGPVPPVGGRDLERDVEGGLGRGKLQAEVFRCFSCGSCLACDNCWILCPDSAVLKTTEFRADGSPYVFDLEYCKGCGICAEECPSGFIEMLPEIRRPERG